MSDSRVALAESAETPVVFCGGPRSLRGMLRIENTSSEKLKLKAARLHSEQLKGPALRPLSEVQLGARLAPGQQAVVPAVLEVDASTPPGIYEAEIDIDGRRQKLEAHVSAVVDFSIQPDNVTIIAGKQREFEREFDIENLGNVSLSLGERCEAPLVTSIGVLEAFRTGLKKAMKGDLKEKLEAMLNEFAAQQIGNLVVTREKITLQPGEKRRAKARFELPPDIESFRHYQTVLELYNASMTVDVYTTSNAPNRPSSNA